MTVYNLWGFTLMETDRMTQHYLYHMMHDTVCREYVLSDGHESKVHELTSIRLMTECLSDVAWHEHTHDVDFVAYINGDGVDVECWGWYDLIDVDGKVLPLASNEGNAKDAFTACVDHAKAVKLRCYQCGEDCDETVEIDIDKIHTLNYTRP